MEDKELEQLNILLDESAKTLVGTSLKRLDELNLPAGNGLTFEQIKVLYASLLKDTIYENFRFIKKLIAANYNVGKIVIRPPSDSDHQK